MINHMTNILLFFHYLYDLNKTRKRKNSDDSEDSTGGDSKRQNQFSFVERATQTKNNAEKVFVVKINSSLRYPISCTELTNKRKYL